MQFQVCGRLVKLKESNAILNNYVESLLKYTEKPYLVPVTSFFPDPRSGELMDIEIGDSCHDVCWSPCGRYIAVSTMKDVFVQDAFSGEILRRLEEARAILPYFKSLRLHRSIAFAPNSKAIAVSEGRQVILWTWESSKLGTPIPDHWKKRLFL